MGKTVKEGGKPSPRQEQAELAQAFVAGLRKTDNQDSLDGVDDVTPQLAKPLSIMAFDKQ